MARGGNVRVSITGDTSGLKKATKDSEGALGRLNNAGKSAFAGISKGALGAGAALVGAGGVVQGLEAVVKANAEAEVSQAKMAAQLKALGISYQEHAKHIDAVIQRVSRLSGLDDEDLQDSFTNLVRATGDVNKALELNATAADLARTKHMDVAQAGQILAKVYGGQTNALKRLVGIGVDPVTKAQDRLKETTKKATAEQIAAAKAADKQATVEEALGLIHDKVKGQAAAYGKTTQGAMDRASVAVENLEESLGKALAPTVAKVANGIAKLADNLSTGKGNAGKLAKSAEDLYQSLKPLEPAFRGIAKAADLVITVFTTQIKVIAKIEGALVGLYRTIIDKVLGAFSTMLDAIGDAAKAASKLPLIGGKFKKVGDAAHDAADKINSVRDKLDDLDGKNVDVNFNIRTYIDGALSGGGGGFAGLNKPAPKRGGSKKRAGKSSVTADTSSAGNTGITATAARIPGVQQGISDIAEAVQGHSGLTVTSTTGGQHAPGSYHYKGQAVDLGGSPAQMAAAVSYIMSSGLYRELAEGIHNPGLSVKNGQVVPASFWGAETWAGHANHVHLAFAGAGAQIPGGSRQPLEALKKVSKPKPPSKYEKFTAAIGHVDLQVSAGVISARRGDDRKLAIVKDYIPKLHGDNRLEALTVRREIQSGRRSAAKDRATTRQQEAQDYRDRKATFYDRSLNNPFLQAYLTHQDYLVATGQLDQATANANKAGALQGAINSGQLSEADIVSAKGMIGDLSAPTSSTGEDPNQPLIDAQNAAAQAAADAAEATRQQTEAINALRAEMEAERKDREAIKSVSLGAAWKALADVINGQIGGYPGAAGRALTAGSGSVARY